MARITRNLIPPSQRHPVDALHDALDLSRGDVVGKRSGFLIMLILSGVIAVAGVLADSTATVIGAMIIAPLATPILGIALGIVTGSRSLVGRSVLWVVAGVGIVIGIGVLLSLALPDTVNLLGNSQVAGRTSPQLLDLLAALATGTAGAFAMCRKDLSAVLPGVAIAISLVPPLGVVGVCAGQGEWDAALGALLLFLSNVVSLVIAGSIVFTLAGYARDPGSSPTVNRRRAYTVVAVLSAIIVIPLTVNTAFTVAVSYWSARLSTATAQWLASEPSGSVAGVRWNGATAIVEVTTKDGLVPDTATLAESLADQLPSFVQVYVDAGVAITYPVISPAGS